MPKLLSATRVLGLVDRLRSSFWFLPSAMVLAATALSIGLVRVDSWLGDAARTSLGWLYAFGPEGARAILSVVASSMITVAGLTFSITMLTLQLASSQFGPRVLRNFMRDRGNQIVLGVFIATFVYCLLVLRTVRGTEDSSFVPHVAVAFGVLLAIASLGVLIYFIHHVASSIRLETLLAGLAAEARSAIDRLYPERLGQGPPEPADKKSASIPDDFESGGLSIRAAAGGYVQHVGDDSLMALAAEHDLIVRIEARPGRFVCEGDGLLLGYPRSRVSEKVAEELRATILTGQERTPEQDLEFSIRRIVDIAQRSLSPGMNDPTTALYCIDRLEEAMRRLAARPLPEPLRYDESGHLRVLTDVDDLDDLACPAFAGVARYGLQDADVAARLLSAMDAVAGIASPKSRASLSALREAIRRESLDRAAFKLDQETLQGR